MEERRESGRDAETFALIGAGMEVHRELGSGFLEAVYQEALEHELGLRNIPFSSQVPLPIQYKHHSLKSSYRADLVCFDSIIVELKTIDQLGSTESAQLINYLKATGLRKGLLMNFKPRSFEFRRVVF
ncbi:GxxExxY protein [Solimonas sp. C16B3]|uniref:GxxExxY protein n=2 Tax=Solimonas marina TaxID=2714601 RepID=A0A969WE61_9GAMM|nr:GxxExxY protein [Solimonas marina]NKF24445.1 GxxExxY protein [Solimonas marina]